MAHEKEFDRRIAAIHGIDRARGDKAGPEDAAMDIRHAEFDAMVDVFLGADYDPVRRQQVEATQVALQQRQLELSRRHDQGEFSDEQFLDASSALIEDTFRKCEKILGPDDFEKLFGAPSHEATGLIDRAAFFGISPTGEAPGQFRADSKFLSTVYTNFCRVSVTPEELVLDFGLNTQMTPTPNEPIKLTDRVVMSFYTAKRLLAALMKVIGQHENTYGALDLDFQRRMRASVRAPWLS